MACGWSESANFQNRRGGLLAKGGFFYYKISCIARTHNIECQAKYVWLCYCQAMQGYRPFRLKALYLSFYTKIRVRRQHGDDQHQFVTGLPHVPWLAFKTVTARPMITGRWISYTTILTSLLGEVTYPKADASTIHNGEVPLVCCSVARACCECGCLATSVGAAAYSSETL